MPSLPDSAPSRWDQPSELEYHPLLARDLNLIVPKDYEDLARRAIEFKRLLAGLIQKLKADR